MSYILEALKKSDQQRQRGATPTLQALQVMAAAPKRPLFIHYGLLATVLLGAGIMIGWLRPWQQEKPPPEVAPIAARPAILISQQVAPAPLAAPPEMAGKAAQGITARKSIPAMQPVHRGDAVKPRISAAASYRSRGPAASMPDNSAASAAVAQEQRAISMAELPPQIQQEIPAMAVQLHAYSGISSERLVNINSRSLREGGFLTPDLRLEQITPDGMIFSYKGYRFQRGIR